MIFQNDKKCKNIKFSRSNADVINSAKNLYPDLFAVSMTGQLIIPDRNTERDNSSYTKNMVLFKYHIKNFQY